MGAEVVQLSAGGSAAQAGMWLGDTIAAINGTPTASELEVASALAAAPAGRAFPVVVRRYVGPHGRSVRARLGAPDGQPHHQLPISVDRVHRPPARGLRVPPRRLPQQRGGAPAPAPPDSAPDLDQLEAPESALLVGDAPDPAACSVCLEP
eukprot:gene18745-2846_t